MPPMEHGAPNRYQGGLTGNPVREVHFIALFIGVCKIFYIFA